MFASVFLFLPSFPPLCLSLPSLSPFPPPLPLLSFLKWNRNVNSQEIWNVQFDISKF